MTNRQKLSGFSLVELLVVIAIIMIILAFAVPKLTRSTMAANEASAIDSVRQISEAQATYASTYPDFGFAPNIGTLGYAASPSQNAAGLIERPLSTGVKDGYQFTVTASVAVPRTTYSVTAVPTTVGKTGQRAFCITQDTGIRFSSNGVGATCLAGNNAIQ